LAKRLLVAFEVGNVGVNAVAFGVLITPVYVQVLNLELIGMGTAKVDVVLRKTTLAPLVSAAAFDHLVKDTNTINYLRSKLFPADYVEPDVPLGLKRLWALMHASEESIGASLFAQPNASATFYRLQPVTNELFTPEDPVRRAGALIGTGSHGTVYKSSTDDETCIKASRVGETLHIAREVKALQLLNAGQCKYIPKLVFVGKLEYGIRQVTVAVPAIVISPLGKPVVSVSGTKKETAKKLLVEMYAALVFAHKKGVFHLDVRLDNIIFNATDNVFVLIDWSSAACSDERVVGFRGSLAFAHVEIHKKESTQRWKPAPKHDFASLAFSVAAFIHGRAVPWDGFSRPLSGDDAEESVFVARRRISSAQLKTACIPATDPVLKCLKAA
jgi:hypothetical protein